MKVLNKVIIVFTNILLIIVLLWLVTIPLTANKKFYLYEFEKNSTVDVTGYSSSELEEIASQIINYLMDRSDTMQIEINDKPVFSNQAIYHMRDVKALYDGGKVIGFISLILFVLSTGYIIIFYKDIKEYLLKYSLITIFSIGVFLLIFAIYAIVDFDSAFVFFHKVIFPDEQKFNDAFFSYYSNYDELPGTDNLMLIKILSENLFMDCGIIIGLFVVIGEAIWFALQIILNKRKIKS